MIRDTWEPAPYVAGIHPSPIYSIRAKAKLLRITKIPTLIAFYKVLLGYVKVEILLISWHFLVFLCIRPWPAHWLTFLFFSKRKVLRWYISEPSLIYVWFADRKFSKFKYFHSSHKIYLQNYLSKPSLDLD